MNILYGTTAYTQFLLYGKPRHRSSTKSVTELIDHHRAARYLHASVYLVVHYSVGTFFPPLQWHISCGAPFLCNRVTQMLCILQVKSLVALLAVFDFSNSLKSLPTVPLCECQNGAVFIFHMYHCRDIAKGVVRQT
jgi:hypothetical protein